MNGDVVFRGPWYSCWRRWFWIGWLVCGQMFDLYGALTNQVFGVGDTWRHQSGNLDSVNWTSPAYDDSAWPAGQGVFGSTTCNCLPAPIQTALSLDTNPPTFQFRRQFTVPPDPGGLAIQLNALLDDGAVFFLNGVEVLRVGMSTNPPSATNQATRSIGNASTYERFLLTGDKAAPLLAGTNLLAVQLHQATNHGNDVVFGCELSLITNLPGTLVRAPYLQRGTWTNVVVRWRTDHPGNSRVWLGTNLANLNLIADNLTVTTNHEVNAMGLSPATRYFYAVGTVTDLIAGSNATHYFVTSPLPGTPQPTRVWVLGDSGTGDANQLAVRNAYEAFTADRHTDLWLMLGDNAYSYGTDLDYTYTVFNIYPSMLRKSVLWPTVGNHDTALDMTYQDNYPYFDIFTLPKQGEAGGLPSATEHYYSFDYANIHFVCLDSMTVPNNPTAVAAMKAWLAADLGETSQDWIVAFFHHPPYSKGIHDSDLDSDSGGLLVQMRTNVLPVLEAHGVDLVLAGHSHSYERSYLLHGHYGYSSELSPTNVLHGGSGRESDTGAYRKSLTGPMADRGAVFVVAGSAGSITGGPLNHPVFYVATNQLGSLVLDFNGRRVDGKFVRENGEITDYFTLLKTNLAPYATNFAISLPANTSTNLQFAGADPEGDPLQFFPDTLPGNGLLADQDPAAGTATYRPAHAFFGSDGFTYVAHDGASLSAPATVSVTVMPAPDADADGLPDAWETEFGVTNAVADVDGDGMSNLAEYLANTNPTNSLSFLRLTDFTVHPAGKITFSWSATGGTRYRVSICNTVNGSFTDAPLPASVEINASPSGAPATQSFTDDFTATGGPPPSGRRFYRVRIVTSSDP